MSGCTLLNSKYDSNSIEKNLAYTCIKCTDSKRIVLDCSKSIALYGKNESGNFRKFYRYPDYSINYPKLVLSEGPLMGTET